MRHTSLSLISLLLFSSLMAQRAGTGPSTPAPAPSAASSTPQSAAPAASAPISAPAVTSHSSTIVTPVSPTAPATHIAPASAFPPTHSFNSPAGNLEPSRPATHVPGPTSRSLVPERKISRKQNFFCPTHRGETTREGSWSRTRSGSAASRLSRGALQESGDKTGASGIRPAAPSLSDGKLSVSTRTIAK